MKLAGSLAKRDKDVSIIYTEISLPQIYIKCLSLRIDGCAILRKLVYTADDAVHLHRDVYPAICFGRSAAEFIPLTDIHKRRSIRKPRPMSFKIQKPPHLTMKGVNIRTSHHPLRGELIRNLKDLILVRHIEGLDNSCSLGNMLGGASILHLKGGARSLWRPE